MSRINIYSYNNYYNRIIKKEDTLEGYAPFLLHSFNANFNPNDGVDTEHVVNYKGDVPDYCIVSDIENGREIIVSRWFVLEAVRLRNGQFSMTLKRDVIADFLDNILTADFIIERGMLKKDDVRIFTDEPLDFNQIKTSETLLQDPRGPKDCAWLVGYIANNYNFQNDIVIPSDTDGYDVMDGIEHHPLYKYNGKTIYTIGTADPGQAAINFHANFTGKISLIPGATPPPGQPAFKEFDQGVHFNAPFKADIVPTIRMERGKYENAALIKVGESYYASPDWDDHMEYELSTLCAEFAGWDYDHTVGQKYTNYINDQLSGRSYCLLDSEVEAMKLQTARVIKDTKTNKFYRIKIRPSSYSRSLNYNITATSDLGQTLRDWSTMYFSGEFLNQKDDTYKLSYYGHPYEVEFDDVSSSLGNRHFNLSDIPHLEDQAFDMIAIPYPIKGTVPVYENKQKLQEGVSKCVIDASTSLDAAVALLKLGTSAIYDLQLLPYCPCPEIFINHKLCIDNNPVRYIEDDTYSSSAVPISVIFLPRRNTIDEFDIKVDYKRSATAKEQKIRSQTDLYRLCSPGFNSIFEVNAEMNGGLDTFRVNCTFKPYTPFIHIAPVFGRLYGRDFKDMRGLTCSEDFSITRVESEFARFEMENKNYNLMFNRQIENMKTNQGFTLQQMAAEQTHKQWNNAIDSAERMAMMTGLTLSGGSGFSKAIGSAVSVAGIAGAGVGRYFNDQSLYDKNVAIQQGLNAEALNFATAQHNLMIGNIKALPNTLAKVSAFCALNKIFPVLEYYTCTQEEKDAFSLYIDLQGMTINRVGKIKSFLPEGKNRFIKGKMIRCTSINEDSHLLAEIGSEMNKGVYL